MLGDGREELLDLLAKEFPSATLSEGGHVYAHVVERVSHLIEHPAGRFELPLDISGGDFEKAALAAVRSTSVLKKPTLLEITQMIWAPPSAAVYVADLCAKDTFAVAVPWHRVEGIEGLETGYRWGAERLHKLRRMETMVLPPS